MRGLQANEQMHMIGHPSDDMSHAPGTPDSPTKILMNSRSQLRREPRFPVFRRKDKVVVQTGKGRGHGVACSNSGANDDIGGEGGGFAGGGVQLGRACQQVEQGLRFGLIDAQADLASDLSHDGLLGSWAARMAAKLQQIFLHARQTTRSFLALNPIACEFEVGVSATATRVSPLLILCSLLLAPCIYAGDKSGVGLNKISLPSGPGSIEGLGDSFEPQLNSGTSSYSVKIAAPPGVAGLQPDVVLRYNSGGGNGHFGIAWSAGLTCIQRQTEKGLPTYGSNDKFTLGGEELVPLADGSFRTENESAFQKIIRQGSGWVIYEKNGTRRFLGSRPMADNPSRIVRPGGGETFDDTFKWCVDEVIDVHGNRMVYQYDTFTDSPGDTYCSQIRYSIFGNQFHAINFDYELRPDAFSSYLSGFQVRTGRRCYQIRVTSSGALVRRYGFSYTLPADDPIEPISTNDAGQLFSMLRQVTQFDKGAGNGNFLPPLRLGYTRFDAANITSGTFLNPAPVSLGNPNLSIADINCDSLPDFFFTDPFNGRHSVVYNHGFGRFSAETDYTAFPTGVTLDQAGADLADYDGDGRIDLVQKAGLSNNQFVFFPNTTRPVGNNDAAPAWGAERTFQTPYPPFDLDDTSVRTLDLNGDKLIDFMKTTGGGFIYYYNRGNIWEEDGLYLFGEPEMGDITYADAIDFTDGARTKLLRT